MRREPRVAGYWDGASAGANLRAIRRVDATARDNAPAHTRAARRTTIFANCWRARTSTRWASRCRITGMPSVIEAARAGKDIYGEKPLALTIDQGRAMATRSSRYKRIFQSGSQQRSDARFRQACEIVRNGRIGKLQTVRCGLPGGTPDLAKPATGKPPSPFRKASTTSSGWGRRRKRSMPGALPRKLPLDSGLFRRPDHRLGRPSSGHRAVGHGRRTTGPVEIRNAKRHVVTDKLWNTATTSTTRPITSGVKLIVSSKERMGVTFEGCDGWVFVTRGGIEANKAVARERYRSQRGPSLSQ